MTKIVRGQALTLCPESPILCIAFDLRPLCSTCRSVGTWGHQLAKAKQVWVQLMPWNHFFAVQWCLARRKESVPRFLYSTHMKEFPNLSSICSLKILEQILRAGRGLQVRGGRILVHRQNCSIGYIGHILTGTFLHRIVDFCRFFVVLPPVADTEKWGVGSIVCVNATCIPIAILSFAWGSKMASILWATT